MSYDVHPVIIDVLLFSGPNTFLDYFLYLLIIGRN